MSGHAHRYASVARAAMPPRETEASALIKAAARLQEAADDTVPGGPAFDAALTHNRRLWTVILSSVANPDSALPDALRAQIMTLANFVLNHTIATSIEPHADKLGCLIAINRELAAGLRAQP